MRVSDIIDEVKEATGSCDSSNNFITLTRAIELLSAKGTFDPLLGTLDFFVDNAYLLALPRDVKTPLRLNINNNPSFARARIFEFMPNAPGSVDGPEVGWQWHERGYSPIQDETKLPSKLRYNVTDAADIGKTLKVTGLGVDGRLRKETLLGAMEDHLLTKYAYAEIRSVIREATEAEGNLWAETGTIGRYYPDEEEPSYRVIKISATGVAVRMLYRKHTFKITSLDDIIPLNSAMAVIRAAEAVRMMQEQKPEDGVALMQVASGMLMEEQQTRDEGASLGSALDVTTVTNTNIITNDLLIVADVYDKACEILGGVGRAKVFDRITDAIEALSNKTQWDSLLCNADVCRAANQQDEVHAGRRNYGYFVLPRYVDAVLAVNVGSMPTTPRNRWFEYHLNGPGSYHWMLCDSFEDCGDTCIINGLPFDRTNRPRRVSPCRLICVPDNNLDTDKIIRVFGVEKLADGTEVEVYRSNMKGYVIPQKIGSYTFPDNAPKWVKIERIQRNATMGFCKLIAKPVDTIIDDVTLGYYYPDELAPRYRMIRVAGCGNNQMIRVKFRKRTHKITALTDVINLRSRLAIENMVRAIMKQEGDPQNAAVNEQIAIGYLQEEQLARNPHSDGSLQFAPGLAPGDFAQVQ